MSRTWAKRSLAHSFDDQAFCTAFTRIAPRAPNEMIEVDDYEQMAELPERPGLKWPCNWQPPMAITRDAGLRGRLAEIAAVNSGQEFLIGQLKDQCWLKGRGKESRADRKRQPGLSAINLDDVLRTMPEFEQ